LRGAISLGLGVKEDDDWDCDVPCTIVTKRATQKERNINNAKIILPIDKKKL